MSPQEFVDDIATHFQALWTRLSISYDRFIAPRTPAHRRGVRALIKRIHDNTPDDFYEKSYEGWYCVGCELFKRENEIVDGHCVLHPTRTLEWTTERNWFFRLTRYQDFLRKLFTRSAGLSPARVAPERDPRPARSGSRRHLDHAVASVLGHSLSAAVIDRRRAGDVGVVRRAAELPHGNRFPRSRLQGTLAGAAPRHRQGHHAAALRDLAGDAAGRGAAAAGARVGARVRAARRRALQQILRRPARRR